MCKDLISGSFLRGAKLAAKALNFMALHRNTDDPPQVVGWWVGWLGGKVDGGWHL